MGQFGASSFLGGVVTEGDMGWWVGDFSGVLAKLDFLT